MVRDQKVAGSNPVTPTTEKRGDSTGAGVNHIAMEGKVDAKAVTLASDFVQQVIEAAEAAKEQKTDDSGEGDAGETATESEQI